MPSESYIWECCGQTSHFYIYNIKEEGKGWHLYFSGALWLFTLIKQSGSTNPYCCWLLIPSEKLNQQHSSQFPLSPCLFWWGCDHLLFAINWCCQQDHNRACSTAVSLGAGEHLPPSLSGQKAAVKPFISGHRRYTTGGGAEFLMHEVTAIHSELMKTLSLAMFKIPWMPVCVRAHRGTDEWYCEVFDTFFNEANCLCIIFGQACNNDVWLLRRISMFSNRRRRKRERWHPVPRWWVRLGDMHLNETCLFNPSIIFLANHGMCMTFVITDIIMHPFTPLGLLSCSHWK